MNTIARAERRQNIATPGFRDLFASLVLLLIIGIFISLTVWRGVAFINVGYQIRGMEKKQTDLLNLNRELKIERAMLSSPERIESIARGRFGMTEPAPDQIRTVR